MGEKKRKKAKKKAKKPWYGIGKYEDEVRDKKTSLRGLERASEDTYGLVSSWDPAGRASPRSRRSCS